MSKSSGILFDLHRFSLNDGPGIRTTVFLKGCPLRCKWCHNPESQSQKPQLSFNAERCIDCMECVKVCPTGAHSNKDGKHFLDWKLCDTSGKCVDVCSSNALEIIGKKSTSQQIIDEVLKDIPYYNKSGGGLTISGGEPLTQFEFTKELLIEAKKHNLHTCIDTCGFAPSKYYLEILPYVDLFLFDYKATDKAEHKQFTGVTNESILSNLELLYFNGAEIILRCPLIPGVNDNNEHLEGIKHIIIKYPQIHSVEIMPYHAMGRDKSRRIGREYELSVIKDSSDIDKQRWLKFFADVECEVKI